jgi:hypothetical protein
MECAMTPGTALLTASLIALAGASLPGKLLVERDKTGTADLAPAERVAAATLTAGHWLAGGVLPLTEDGLYRVHIFYSPACDDVIFLTEVSANGEMQDLLTELAKPNGEILFLQGGRLHRELPALRAYLYDKLGPLLLSFGLLREAGHHRTVAIVAAGACRYPPHLPWPTAAGRGRGDD